jgi:hypothetical protein
MHFSSITAVREPDSEYPVMFLDMLRAGVTRTFGLAEALYLDADTDVLENLDPIPKYSSASILWTPNAVSRPAVADALSAFGLDTNPPYVEPAVIYLRRDFTEEYREVVNTGKLELSAYLPSVNAWNVVVRRGPANFKLPAAYNVMAPRLLEAVESGTRISILHFCGVHYKRSRFAYGMNKWPEAIVTYTRNNLERLPVNWGDPPDAWREATSKA